MIRTITDHLKQSHTLDLDAVLIDGQHCLSVQATEQYVQFETVQGAITCELAQFWHEVAGPDLTPQEAGLLLAECLVRQVVLQHTSSALHEVMCLLTRATALSAEISSFNWLITRIDPLARQAMSAYDGTPEVTDMLARILQCDPATIQMWARQLGLDMLPIPPVPAPTEPVAAISDAKHPFLWTPERRDLLEEALSTCTGTTVIERARQIAALHNWPEASVRSKLYEMQRPRRDGRSAARESDGVEAEQEGDQHAEQREVVTV